jgi:hypothetical protein
VKVYASNAKAVEEEVEKEETKDYLTFRYPAAPKQIHSQIQTIGLDILPQWAQVILFSQ